MSAPKPDTNYSEPEYAKKVDRTKVPYYTPNIEHRLVPETQELLEKYSRVPRDQQLEHIHKIRAFAASVAQGLTRLTLTVRQRDQAWDIRAYPCTGLGSWLTPQLCRMPIYDEILRRLREGAILVDVGTFLGHDLRRLAYDGAPSDQLYGVDIANHWDVGYDLFRDREHFRGHFIEADLLSTTSPELLALRGGADVVVVSQVLHQWNLDGQTRAVQALITLTKPGSLIVGNQIGNPEAQEFTLKSISAAVWRHNPDSFVKMFEAAGAATGTRWETQACMRTFEEMGWGAGDASWMEPNVGLVEFVAKRVS